MIVSVRRSWTRTGEKLARDDETKDSVGENAVQCALHPDLTQFQAEENQEND